MSSSLGDDNMALSSDSQEEESAMYYSSTYYDEDMTVSWPEYPYNTYEDIFESRINPTFNFIYSTHQRFNSEPYEEIESSGLAKYLVENERKISVLESHFLKNLERHSFDLSLALGSDPEMSPSVYLYLASKYGRQEIVEELYWRPKLNVDLLNSSIYAAIFNDHLEILKLLLLRTEANPSFNFNVTLKHAIVKNDLAAAVILIADKRIRINEMLKLAEPRLRGKLNKILSSRDRKSKSSKVDCLTGINIASLGLEELCLLMFYVRKRPDAVEAIEAAIFKKLNYLPYQWELVRDYFRSKNNDDQILYDFGFSYMAVDTLKTFAKTLRAIPHQLLFAGITKELILACIQGDFIVIQATNFKEFLLDQIELLLLLSKNHTHLVDFLNALRLEKLEIPPDLYKWSNFPFYLDHFSKFELSHLIEAIKIFIKIYHLYVNMGGALHNDAKAHIFLFLEIPEDHITIFFSSSLVQRAEDVPDTNDIGNDQGKD